MTLIRWRPLHDVTAWNPGSDLWGEFSNMHHDIDRMFDRFLQGGTSNDGNVSSWLPAVDIVERDADYVVKIEVPGVKKEDIKITVADDVLTIRGEKKQEKESKEKNYHRVERAYGSFQRSFTLPSFVQSDKIKASYDNGVLTIALPKVEEAKPKEIEVKVK